MRLIPPEGTPIQELELAPMTLTWSGDAHLGERTSGHSGEYLLGFPCITGLRGQGPDIPDVVAQVLAANLGSEWSVSNRGSRIEIAHVPNGPSDHELISSAATLLLEQTVLPRFGRNKF